MTELARDVHFGQDTEKGAKVLSVWRGLAGLPYSYLRADSVARAESTLLDGGSRGPEHRVLCMGFRCFLLSQSLIRAINSLSSEEERSVRGSATNNTFGRIGRG